MKTEMKIDIDQITRPEWRGDVLTRLPGFFIWR
jgi:hypothetical protein